MGKDYAILFLMNKMLSFDKGKTPAIRTQQRVWKNYIGGVGQNQRIKHRPKDKNPGLRAGVIIFIYLVFVYVYYCFALFKILCKKKFLFIRQYTMGNILLVSPI